MGRMGHAVFVLAATGILGLGLPGCESGDPGPDRAGADTSDTGDDDPGSGGDAAADVLPGEVAGDLPVDPGDVAVDVPPEPGDLPGGNDVPPAGDAGGFDMGPDGGCDWVTSAGCEPPLKCAFSAGTPRCGPAGTGGDGANCATTGDAFCAPGFTCLTTSGTENDSSFCRAHCRVDADCPTGSGQMCLQYSESVPPTFCTRVRACDPLGDGCESGDGCYPALFNDGTPICLASGKKTTGEPCQSLSECKKGSVCVPGDEAGQGKCRDLCAVGTACPEGGDCEGLLDTAVGVCP